ncbi:sensor histidine kinase [Neiella marina]|uniref:histidine kinase n=1 Tax=Neiella holothuriorum TaxID=2870530 RepID=A0ABS7EIG4_9GAMM|nr:sensor histidine kinase [Neiella holothuriorum]MBW8192148.1 sensor histidine kinase [Neiella holothuriorum]
MSENVSRSVFARLRDAMQRDDLILSMSGLITYAVVTWVDALNGDLTAFRFSLIVVMALAFSYATIWQSGNNIGRAQRIALLLQCVCALLIYANERSLVAPVLFVLCAAQLPAFLGLKRWWWGLIGLNLALFAIDAFSGLTQHTVISNLVFLSFELFAALSTRSRLLAQHQQKLLEATHLKLVAAQSRLTQQSEHQERLRIARDLHDSVGHHLTALSLQLEHALHRPPEQPHEFYQSLRQAVNNTLQQTRTIVHHMRQQSNICLTDFMRQLRRGLPAAIELQCQLEHGLLSSVQNSQLAHCIEEAISNALRHGNATKVLVSLEPHPAVPGQLLLIVSDNGQGCRHIEQGSGLRGIQERVSSLNGQAQFVSNAAGFVLSITLPVATDIGVESMISGRVESDGKTMEALV